MNFKKRINGSWVDTPNYIHNTSTDTITTLPAVVYANGTTATVGLKGQTVQSSIPSPTSPVMPQGTGERTGNLFDLDTWLTDKGISYTRIGSEYTITGNAVLYTQPYYFSESNIDISISAIIETVTANSPRIDLIAADGTPVLNGAISENIAERTGISCAGLRLNWSTNGVFKIKAPMINTGSTPLPYEPYGYKIPISSANTTTPIYLGEVETTRKIKKYVFTGEENGTIYSTGTNRKGIEITGITGIIGGNADIAILAICTHYQPNMRNALYRNTDNGISNAYQNDRIIFYDASCQTVEAFQQFCTQQYANGTPVTVWYVLATEETGIVNEPLMKIGDYADEVSGISIPTTAGANTLSIGTALQPSEVTINYKGWHPVQSVHEAENGAWT